jgi:hypothetical protein
MTISVRLADLDTEQEELIGLLDRNFPQRPNRGIHRKRLTNPCGPGWSWVAHMPGEDKIIAAASVFPRTFQVDGTAVVCGQVIDFAIDAPYRSLGPAVLLQKATFEPASSGAVAFCYDCPPHERGMSTFVRLGMQPNCDIIRYALLLRSDDYFRRRMGNSSWIKPFIATANVALRTRRAYVPARDLEIAETDKAFDEEYSQLDRSVSSLGAVRASRSAEELNWRYGGGTGSAAAQNVARKYRVFEARRSRELIGFAVLSTEADGTACIHDLFALDLAHTGGALIGILIDVCRREKLTRLDCLCSPESCSRSLLELAGFRARERVYRVVTFENACTKLLRAGLQWGLSGYEVM